MPKGTCTLVAALLLLACQRGKPTPSEVGSPGEHPSASSATGAKAAPPMSGIGEAPGSGAAPRSNVARYHLRKQDLTDAALAKWLDGLPEPTGLTDLDLRDNSLTADSLDAIARSRLGMIEALLLSGNALGDAGAQRIATLGKFQNARVVYLAGTQVGPKAVGSLLGAGSKLNDLGELDLSNNALGDAGIEALAQAEKCKSLTSLSLSNVGMTDRGARALAASPHLSALRVLEVDGNQLTKAGIAALEQSPKLSQAKVFAGKPAP